MYGYEYELYYDEREDDYWDSISWPRRHVGDLSGLSRYCRCGKSYYKRKGNRRGRQQAKLALKGYKGKIGLQRVVTGWDII